MSIPFAFCVPRCLLTSCDVPQGYNIVRRTPILTSAPPRPDLVTIKISHFGLNFADVCIRLGLYESAIRYVGYPIVPGFDVAGTVLSASPTSPFKPGDSVYGCTLFGGYSTRLTIPANQLRLKPANITTTQACALPAVSFTAIHALTLAGFPAPGKSNIPLLSNRSVLIHSASGGVGGMLVQFAKLCGCTNVVGVVGRKNKVKYCESLGADSVIYKEGKSKKEWWAEVEAANSASGGKYMAVFDANGVETIGDSYKHLDMCGRLIVYGFHSNMPVGRAALSPWSWIKMAWGMARMPSVDYMGLTLDSRGVMGFNLSFFEKEVELIECYFATIDGWVSEGKLTMPECTTFGMEEVGDAHELIQSGRSVGKIVIDTSR